MKKSFCIGLVCFLAVAVVSSVQAQEKKKAATAEHAHDKEHKHEGDDKHEHDKDHAHAEKHDQAPPHGGTVVKLGKHGFNLEFVRDPDAGKFQVFVLNGHMEYADVAEKSFDVIAKANGQEHRLTLNRVGTGDKSSAFEGSADWIKTTKKFEGSIPEITLKGKTFTNISFTFPASKKAHKH